MPVLKPCSNFPSQKTGRPPAYTQLIASVAILAQAIAEIVVRRKPPRMSRGELISPNETERIMIKIRPMMLEAATWRSALYLLRGFAVACGGNVSEKQPAPPGINKLQGGNRRAPN